jgi:hypothetical protein
MIFSGLSVSERPDVEAVGLVYGAALRNMKLEGASADDGLVGDRKGSVKVTITPCQPKQLTHLPKRQPVDIGFSDLTYTVSEGRKKSEY